METISIQAIEKRMSDEPQIKKREAKKKSVSKQIIGPSAVGKGVQS